MLNVHFNRQEIRVGDVIKASVLVAWSSNRATLLDMFSDSCGVWKLKDEREQPDYDSQNFN